ncbi:putative zinc metalloprotease Lmo1318 [Sporosarcina luteola]|uniref:Zinc metalloprotease n=1 Tax=Sporosarcina luteola TaxID=582850 RepID=A0A511Z3G6_9BACL|nr:RIP metalloprotease RseP [Sporosarcina luteola]GEN81993.1 putative zinc metalloprotease Lmo1318 [Sporosarcina luteola]
METVIAFIIVFGSLVFFHELGHFLFAKKAGIMVREFAIGMGPKILALRKKETLYTIRILPLGGYVRMAGEDFDTVELQPGFRVGIVLNDADEVEKMYLNREVSNPNVLFLETESADLSKALYIEGYDEDGNLMKYNVSRNAIIYEKGQETLIAPYDRQFDSKPLGSRALAIFAGPLFNFILAFFIFLALGLINGVPKNEPIIDEVVTDSPAYAAGMEAGDYIKEVDGTPVDKWTEFTEIIQQKPGENVQVKAERAGELVTMTMIPSVVEDSGQKFGQIGVKYKPEFEKSPLKALKYGATETVSWISRIFELLGMLVTGKFSIDALSGPVGIYKATGDMAQHGIFTLMNWAAVLSINLGIMNLLPLPALDGGRLLFFLFEGVRGKPVDKQKEGMVHFVGIMLLMVLMLVVTWNDIQRFFF